MACHYTLRLIALLAVLSSCQRDNGRYAKAKVIESLNEAPGGPKASAEVGDFLLENDQILAVIEKGGLSSASLEPGGSLIDLDLNRGEEKYRSGRGLDLLGQIATIANIKLPDATNEPNVRITTSAKGAEVTTAAPAQPVVPMVLALNVLINQNFAERSAINLYTEYELRPGERMVRVVTTAGFDVPFCPVNESDGCNEECDDALYDDDCECETLPARCTEGTMLRDADRLPDGPGRGLLDIMLGDLPRPLGTGLCTLDAECEADESCVDVTSQLGGELKVCRGNDQRGSGAIFGDFLLYSGSVDVFLSGPGFDSESDIRRLFESGGDTLATPLQLDGVFATGEGVSYGYVAPEGKTLVPIFGGPFSMGVNAAASCPSGQEGCLSKKLVRFERWISVGEGDVSSAMAPLAKANGETLAEVRGQVLARSSGRALSGAKIFALSDPRALPCDASCQAACNLDGLTDDELATWSAEDVMEANRCRTRTEAFLTGTGGVMSFAETDVGKDPFVDGSYQLQLPPGDYVLVAQVGGHTLSQVSPVKLSKEHKSSASFVVEEPGRLSYSLYDQNGDPSPGRVIVGVCLPQDPCADETECQAGQECRAGSCACTDTPELPLELGGPLVADGVLAMDVSPNGRGEIELPPGEYEVLSARGPFYNVDRQRVVLESNQTTALLANLDRQVDRVGWTSTDFHVHSVTSIDSDLPLEERAYSFLADDMDFISSSDHDWLTRFEPLLEALGLRDRLGSQVGVEVTTQNLGHFLGFPLAYKEWNDGERLVSNGAINWRKMPPSEMFSALHEMGDGETPVVVDIPHPFSYFDAYRIDPVSLESVSSVLSFFDPLVDGGFFSGDFDAMELINTNNFDLIRRPTIGEMRDLSVGSNALIAALRAGEIDSETFARDRYALSMEITKRVLQRTQAEQTASRTGAGNEFACQCLSNGDCAPGFECDLSLLSCVTSPAPSGALPDLDGLCRAGRGVVDDWFNMLNRGVVRTGVSGSDIHGEVAGSLRTMVRTGGTTAPYLTSKEVSTAVLEGRAIVTNGPMIHFEIDDGEIGDTINIAAGATVQLKVRVERASWYGVDRVEVYRNGELIHWAKGCESTRAGDEEEGHGHPCVASDGVVVFEAELAEQPDEDAWYVVTAMGLDGPPLSPVYSSVVRPRLGTSELTQRIFDLIPALREFGSPDPPTLYPAFPYAITNPIWVDVGGDGITPQDPAPSWCREGDLGC